jgi:hypothetical protein
MSYFHDELELEIEPEPELDGTPVSFREESGKKNSFPQSLNAHGKHQCFQYSSHSTSLICFVDDEHQIEKQPKRLDADVYPRLVLSMTLPSQKEVCWKSVSVRDPMLKKEFSPDVRDVDEKILLYRSL